MESLERELAALRKWGERPEVDAPKPPEDYFNLDPNLAALWRDNNSRLSGAPFTAERMRQAVREMSNDYYFTIPTPPSVHPTTGADLALQQEALTRQQAFNRELDARRDTTTTTVPPLMAAEGVSFPTRDDIERAERDLAGLGGVSPAYGPDILYHIRGATYNWYQRVRNRALVDDYSGVTCGQMELDTIRRLVRDARMLLDIQSAAIPYRTPTYITPRPGSVFADPGNWVSAEAAPRSGQEYSHFASYTAMGNSPVREQWTVDDNEVPF